jgi:tryptophan-rich sensory protein
MKSLHNLLGLLVALLIPVGGGGAVGLLTSQSISTWYASLKKPAWNPPSWVFAPAWTALYGLMGLASWLVWRNRSTQKAAVSRAFRWYGLQLRLNFLWSIIFFLFRRPDLALLEIGVLWGTIFMTTVKFARVSWLAMTLMLPYQFWVTFAAALNLAVWWLNKNDNTR